MKERILELWRQVDRPGIENLISFLETSDFFEAPCSINHHLAKVGGLAEHSLNVHNALSEKCYRYLELQISGESVIICALAHDFCKINYFKPGGSPCSDAQYSYLKTLFNDKKNLLDKDSISKALQLCDVEGLRRDTQREVATLLIDWLKNRPKEPFPELPQLWSYEDLMPLGHGEKSLIILQQFIKIELHEMLAIRWHMGPWDISGTYGKWAYDAAVKIHPLVTLLHLADMEATHIIER